MTDRTTEKRKTGYRGVLLIAGFLFLCNPLYACVDVLPDPIGWVLIWIAVRSFSERNDNFAKAGKWALINAGIGLLRTFFMFAFPAGGEPSNVMMATGITAFLDVAGMIVFFRLFYKGFKEVSRYASGEDLYLNTENDRFLSVVFSIGRGLFAFLPELTAAASLFVSHYGPGDLNVKDPEKAFETLQQIGSSRDLFWIVFAVLEVILAVVWLVAVLPRLRRFASDPGVLSRVTGPVPEEEIESSARDRTGAGWLTVSKFLIAAGALCCMDIQADGIRFLPFCLFPVFLILTGITLDRFRSVQHQPPLFRKTRIPLLISAVLLAGFEFFRRFATVWDARAYEETEFWQLGASAGWLLLALTVLFIGWILFAFSADDLSVPFHSVGFLYYEGLPFAVLVLVSALYLISAALPAMDRVLITVRILSCWLFAFILFRRMSMLEERIRLRLAEEPTEPDTDSHRHGIE
ncbi:MAG: hypothetical protein ILO68_01635 [Clostridia bacterium]|nr:hypothetical protein [Clostridia bacterium]